MISLPKSQDTAMTHALYAWVNKDKKEVVILFLRDKDILVYGVYKDKILESQKIIDREDHSLDETIDYLKQCSPQLHKRRVFAKRFAFLSLDNADFAITLTKKGNDLEWEVRSKTLFPSTHYFTFESTHLHRDCSSDTLRYIEEKLSEVKSKADSVQETFFSFFEIDLNTNNTSSSPTPGEQFYLKPISRDSDIDPSIKISRFTWAVTLIKNVGKSNQHAQIAIEGIRDEQDFSDGVKGKKEKDYKERITDNLGNSSQITHDHFKLIAHFTGSKIKVKTVSHIHYLGRSETWKKPFGLVKKMIVTIQSKINNPPPYSHFGRYSILSKGEGYDSCISWTMNELERSEITTFTKKSARIMAITSHYMKKNPTCKNSGKL